MSFDVVDVYYLGNFNDLLIFTDYSDEYVVLERKSGYSVVKKGDLLECRNYCEQRADEYHLELEAYLYQAERGGY